MTTRRPSVRASITLAAGRAATARSAAISTRGEAVTGAAAVGGSPPAAARSRRERPGASSGVFRNFRLPAPFLKLRSCVLRTHAGPRYCSSCSRANNFFVAFIARRQQLPACREGKRSHTCYMHASRHRCCSSPTCRRRPRAPILSSTSAPPCCRDPTLARRHARLRGS